MGRKDITEKHFQEINEIHEQERDIAKRWSKENVIFSIIGIENQTTIDKDMSLRVISYDGASYKCI